MKTTSVFNDTVKPTMASSPPTTAKPHRECLITIGATATFTPLLHASLSPSFCASLVRHNYTHLTIQCGADLSLAQTLISSSLPPTPATASASASSNPPLPTSEGGSESERGIQYHGLKLKLFSFRPAGLGEEMRRCKAPPQGTGGGKSDGVVICHAGAGTILDCLRLDIPTIVVPNTSLLDNHQDELARELERQGYVTRGSVESVDELVEALGRSEKKNLTRERTRWGGGGGKAEGRRGVVGVMDEEVGYEMRMREVLD